MIKTIDNGNMEMNSGKWPVAAGALPKWLDGIGLDAAVTPATVGRFLSGSFTNEAGTRDYRLYVPASFDKRASGQTLPLLVALHGCAQDPGDFAVGTRLNEIAERWPCLVLYPAQPQSANGQRCWNWFLSENQQRDQGEPAILAGMTRDIMATWGADARQVYVAGLSAGGAMAVILGTTYPDVYAAVGIHSGLPYAAAKDLHSAYAAMSGASNAGSTQRLKKSIPLIVFHGDRDTTVHPRNGEDILRQASPRSVAARVDQGQVDSGHTYTRTRHEDDAGRVVAEHWLVHGAGHAWFGGSSAGSYTDRHGPDASREMLRFFSTHSIDPT